MVTDSEIMKIKLTIMAVQLSSLKQQADGNDMILFVGKTLTPYIRENPVADYIYDTINLLDELSNTCNPKKLLNQLYVMCKKARKSIEPGDFAAFTAMWMANEVEATGFERTTLPFLIVCTFSLLYEGTYAGHRHTGDFCLIQGKPLGSDVLSGILFVEACYALLYSCFHFEIDSLDFSVEFQNWYTQLSANKHIEYYVDILKYLCNKWGCKHIFDMLGIENAADINRIYQNKESALIKIFDQTIHQPAKTKKILQTRVHSYAENLFGWDRDRVFFAITLVEEKLDELVRFCYGTAIKDGLIMMHLSQNFNCSPWGICPLNEGQIEKASSLTNHFFSSACPKDILTKRKFYIKESGIILHFSTPIASIESLYIQEIHKNMLHYMWISAKLESNGRIEKYRNLMLPIENITYGTTLLSYEIDYIILLVLINWLGVRPLLEELQNATSTEMKDIYSIAFVLKKLSMIRSLMENTSVEYRSQPSLKETSVLVGKAKNMSGDYVVELKDITNFIRKLPVGQKASQEAVIKAQQVRMDLPQGYTFVSGW